MNYPEYLSLLRRWTPLALFREYGQVLENGRPYPLVCLSVPGPRCLVLTTGFHGDEPAGPLTLLHRLSEIVTHARAHGVGLRIYPCINPSGFEAGTRYNASGERPNNDLLRYETAPGSWKGELGPGESFLRIALYQDGPQETRPLLADLERHPPPDAALDIHQDAYLPGAFTYAYTFGDSAPYRPLLEASSRFAALARRRVVDEAQQVSTDDDGLIQFADGSVTDYFMRRGIPYTAALETTRDCPMAHCEEINLIWIRGFVELAGSRPLASPPPVSPS